MYFLLTLTISGRKENGERPSLEDIKAETSHISSIQYVDTVKSSLRNRKLLYTHDSAELKVDNSAAASPVSSDVLTTIAEEMVVSLPGMRSELPAHGLKP